MSNAPYRTMLTASSVLVFLVLIGWMDGSWRTWGIHQLAFIPIQYGVLFLAGWLAVLLFLRSSRSCERIIGSVARFLGNHPWRFLFLSMFFFVIIAIIFRVRAPLLGDGFFLVKNFSESFRDVAPLYYRNEPLATALYALVFTVMKASSFQTFMNGFLTAGCLFGIGFIGSVFFLTKLLASDTASHLLSFVYLLVVPYMQLFFGYVEVYAVVLLALTLYTLAAVGVFKGRIPFPVAALSFLILFLTHYLTIVLLPSLIILAHHETTHGRKKPVLTGFAVIGIILFAILFIVKFDIDQFTSSVPHHHYLPLTLSADAVNRQTEPYTIFSLNHALDLLNYVLLIVPVVPIVLILAVRRTGWRTLADDPVKRFLLAGIVPVILALGIIKLDLGMWKDWDIFAPSIFFFSLYTSLLIGHKQQEGFDSRVPFLAIAATFFLSFSFWGMNATTDGAVKRYHALLDTRALSPGAYYTACLHLAQYYHQVSDRNAAVETWSAYTKIFPRDPRGYRNTLTNLKYSGGITTDAWMPVYASWLAAIPEDSTANQEYLAYCIRAGNEKFAHGDFPSAQSYYEKAVTLAPSHATTLNNLGSVYAQTGKLDEAIACFQKAIARNPSYHDALMNLGNAYADRGNSDTAREYFARAKSLENVDRHSPDTSVAHYPTPFHR